MDIAKGLCQEVDMICYRDKTFCPFSECANFNKCPDALTDEVQEQADKWWEGWSCGGETPISKDVEPPECYMEEK